MTKIAPPVALNGALAVGDVVRTGRGRLRVVSALLSDGLVALSPVVIDDDYSVSVVSDVTVRLLGPARDRVAALGAVSTLRL